MKLNIKKILLTLALAGLQTISIAAGPGSYEAGGGLAPGYDSTGIGADVSCGTSESISNHCIGRFIRVTDDRNVAIGDDISVVGSGSTVVGNHLTINGKQVNAVGSWNTIEADANVVGNNNVVGARANSVGDGNTVGSGASNFGSGNTVANGSNAIATNNSIVTTNNSVFGGNSVNTTGYRNTIVLGGNAGTVLRNDEVSVSNRTIGGVRTATQADQATNLGQVQAADEATYQRAIAYTDNALANINATDYSSDISSLKNDVGGLRNQVNVLSKKIDAVNAMTAAQSNILYNPYGSQYQIGVGAGYSGGSSALSVKVMGSNKNRTVMYSAGASIANGSKGSIGAGMSFNF